MALSAREKYVAIGVAAAVGLFGFDRLVLEPFSGRGRAIADEQTVVETKLDKADGLFKKRRALRPVWTEMKTTGGLKYDPSEAETQLMQSLVNWAQESNVTWTNLSSEHVNQGPADSKSDKPESKFKHIGVHATGYGPMSAMAKLMWRVEAAPKLLRVTEVQISPRKEATDDLQIQLSVATVSLNPDADTPADGSRPLAAAGDRGAQP